MEDRQRTMRNKILITLAIALLIVAVAVWYFAVYSASTEPEQEAQNSSDAREVEPAKPVSGGKFAELTGEAFDEAYVADMLAHHEGALNMAEQAQAVTAHEEIRRLAGDITRSQGLEIAKMKQWQRDWGYTPATSAGHGSHNGVGMDMGGDMVEMQNRLIDLSGEAYDKEFLKQMILHHEQAIEMSQHANQNAKHQEIKDLASEVISAQEKEVGQMKQWQKNWGYDQ